MLSEGVAGHKEPRAGQPQCLRVEATPRGMVPIPGALSPRDASKRWRATADACLGRGGVRGPGSGGAPAWPSLGGRPRSRGAAGGRRRRQWPRGVGRARASGPAPLCASWEADQAPAMGNAAGRAGMRWPRLGWRKRRGAPLASLRSNATRRARRSPARAPNVPENPGSPEGCSQPSSPPLCGGVMIGWVSRRSIPPCIWCAV